ncbi:MAG: ATP-dependent zinc metalloprotease FtsH, partial [Actinomycetota bacterium]
VIDEEVERLVHEADERATALLKENREGLESVAALLVERETIDGKDVLAALGRTAANEAPVVIEDRAPTG